MASAAVTFAFYPTDISQFLGVRNITHSKTSLGYLLCLLQLGLSLLEVFLLLDLEGKGYISLGQH